MDDSSPYRTERDAALAAVVAAGEAVADLYARSAAATYAKADGSPVTDADLAADAIIRRILHERFPGDPILTEEGQDDPSRLSSPRCWIADPIDGTQQFVERTGEFDVLLALVVNGRPVVAAAIQPPTGRLSLAVKGGGAWTGTAADDLRRVVQPSVPPARPRVGSSIWFGWPDNAGVLPAIAAAVGGVVAPDSEIGFTPRSFVPPGACDLLLGFRPDGNQAMAWEWDFAVGDLFLKESGGLLTDLAGRPFVYNKPRPRHDDGLVAATHPALHAAGLAAVRAALARQSSGVSRET